MFSFAATPITFVGLLVLFSWCVLWSTVELVRATTVSERVTDALHLVMSVVMLLMVPHQTWAVLSGIVPVPVLAALFVLGAAWFLRDAVYGDHSAAHRPHLVGHAVMFLAMAWHLAGMAVAMATMPMAGEHGMAGPGAPMLVVAGIGIPFMIALLVMGCAALYSAFLPGLSAPERAHHVMGAAMNLGMFWMSVGLLRPLLPFLTVLQQ